MSAPTPSADVHAELQLLASRLREAVLNVSWRQWRVLGAGSATRPIAGEGEPSRKDAHRQLHALVDPEALVLVSLMFLDHERRLGDLLHDWGARNSDLLSVQRMKNLEGDYPEPARGLLTHRLAWFATVACDEGKDLRWKSLAQGGSEGSVEPLGEANTFARSGRPDAPSGAPTKARATRARLMADATLMLRLRLGLGVGVKADLITFLLARVMEWATVRDITEATGYTVAAVRRAAEDLAAARLIESLDGAPTVYRATHDAWTPLLGLEDRPPRWASWHERFVLATAFHAWSEEVRERALSDYAFGAGGRQLLERYRSAFERDDVAVWSAHTPVTDWGVFVGGAVRALAGWMEEFA